MKSILLLPLLLFSCKDSTTTTASTNNSKQMISANELMRALGGSDFQVILPDDIDASSIVGLAFKYPDGTIERFGGSSAWKAGEKVRVILFLGDNKKPKYSVVSNNGTLSGTFPKKFDSEAWSSSKPLYKTGESLIRFSTDGSVTHGDKLSHDDVDLILHVKAK